MRSLRVFGVFSLLILLFLVPAVAAWFWYDEDDVRPVNTTNRGELIQPPFAVDQLSLLTAKQQPVSPELLQGHWWLLLVVPSRCDEECRQHLYVIRQVRLATGKDMNRVARALVSLKSATADSQLDALLQNQYPGTYHFYLPSAALIRLVKATASAKLALQQGYLYLVDPHGNVMMGYSLDRSIQDIYKDLTHLLKISQIG